MERKAFVVTGLGFGDEGKGATVNYLASKYRAHTVIRTGGPQALHHVVRADGMSHVFQQFGSGTLRGSGTHLSKHMLIDPHAILAEGDMLKYQSKINSVFATLTIHEDALVITPFQAIAGRLRELFRGKNRLGSVGIGVGETMRDSDVLKHDAIRARDLGAANLRDKLKRIRDYKWSKFGAASKNIASDLSSEEVRHVRTELYHLENDDTIEWAVDCFTELVRRSKIVDSLYVARNILADEGTVILEGSQGVLLDRYMGFHPYTTQVRTLPFGAKQILGEAGYDGAVTSLGVTRAYHTRHGGGPFVSESSEMTAALPDEINKTHPWQGSFRVGHLDIVALQYALDACEGSIDRLVVTCLDRIWKQGAWDTCVGYRARSKIAEVEREFLWNGDTAERILASEHATRSAQLKKQESIGRQMSLFEPCIAKRATTGMSLLALSDMCAHDLRKHLRVPVHAVSTGPTERDVLEVK